MPAILIVEDEAKMRRLLELNLGEDGFTTLSAGDAEAGLKLLRENPVDLVVTDLKLPGMNGLEFLQAVKRQNAALPVVVMTAFGTVETAVEAMKAGASDYVLKPFSLAEMRMVIRKELDVRNLREENRSLREALGKRYAHPNIVARSAKMQETLATVERVAPTNATVLLGGESGVGKDLIARAIHEKSRRATGPFVKINSTAIPENLLESELFGYEKGAFTGAAASKPGKFELADKGTLFLDEIGDVPPATQVKLLRVLQEREFERLGGTKTIKVDVRLVAATNRESACRARAGNVPGRSLLPLECCAHRYRSAARTQGRYSGAGEFIRFALCGRFGQAGGRNFAGGYEGAGELSLAGKCARATEHYRAGVCAGEGNDDRGVRHSSGFASRERRGRRQSFSAGGHDAGAVGRRNDSRGAATGAWQQEPGGAVAGAVAECAAVPAVEDWDCG